MSAKSNANFKLDKHQIWCVEETIPEEDRASVLEAMQMIFDKGGFLTSKGMEVKIGFSYPTVPLYTL